MIQTQATRIYGKLMQSPICLAKPWYGSVGLSKRILQNAVLKREFAAGDNLQALIAIKCLDEA